MLKINVVENAKDLERAFSVMKELRTHLDLEAFLHVVSEAKKADDYKIAALVKGEEFIAVMGYRILTDFVHGRHVYVDDLVTIKDARSQGHGARLLAFAEEEARKNDCVGLRLCTGIENEPGKKFYEREGWTARALAFKKKLKSK